MSIRTPSGGGRILSDMNARPYLILLSIVASGLGCRARPATALSIAAAGGDLAGLERLLAAGANPEEPGPGGWKPLHWASRNDQAEAARLLVRRGALVDSRDGGPNGWTPLMHAIHKGANHAAGVLLDSGADVDARADDVTALVLAAGYGNTVMVVELLSRGAEPSADALWGAAGGMSLADLTDGPPLGTCFPDVVDALRGEAPGLRLQRSLSTRVLAWTARSPECAALLGRLTSDPS